MRLSSSRQVLCRWRWAVVAVTVAGCGDRLPPPPSILSVTPQSGRIGVLVALRVEGRFPLRAVADIGGKGKSAVDATYRARLGDTQLVDVQLSSAGALAAVVPADLAPGVYDLTVVDPFGREGALPRAYEAKLPASALAFTSAPQLVAAGACSSPLAFELEDATAVRSTTDVETTVSFAASPAGGFGFFADPTCTLALSQIVLPAGRASGEIFFAGQVPGLVALTAAAPGLSPANQTATVTELPARLAFATAPQAILAGACSAAATLESEDGSGAKAVAPGPIVVALSGPPSLKFFDDASCATPTASVTIRAGASSADFYFRGAGVGMPAITASAPGLTSATQVETINAGAATRLTFTTPTRTFTAGACPGLASVITAQLQDGSGNPVNAGVGGQALTASSTSTGTVSWYGDSTCSALATGGTFTIAAGASTVNLFYQDTSAGSPSVSLVNPSGLTSPAPQPETVVAGLPSVLAFVTPSRTIDALLCAPLASTVQTQDGFGNPANVAADLSVGLAASPAGLNPKVFAMAGCAAPVANLTIPTGTSQASLFFSADNPGTLTINATAVGMTGVSQNHTINSAPPTRLALSSAASPAEAGACATVRVARQDALGRDATPANPAAVALSALPATGLELFSDSACAVALAGVSIAGGAASTNFFVKGTTGGSYALSASSAGLTDGTFSFVVLPMVRRGTCSIADSTSSVTCPVLPAIPGNDISRTLMIFAASNAANTPGDANASCRLTTGASVDVVCDRGASGANSVSVSWQTVSFARDFAGGGVSVEHFSGIFSGGFTAAPIAVPVVAVDLAKSFVLFSSFTFGTDNWANDFFTAKLTSPTNVDVTLGGDRTAGGLDGWAVQVVSFAGSNVVRDSTSGVGSGAAVTVPGLAADLTRTFPLFTARNDVFYDTDDICKRKLRGVVTNATTLDFTRGDGAGGACIDSAIAELAWERVELPAGALVQSVTVTHPNNAAAGWATIATAVDVTRSVVFMAGQGQGGQAGGESNFGGLGNDIVGAVLGTASLSGTTVTVTRPAINLGTASFTPFVVQFVP